MSKTSSLYRVDRFVVPTAARGEFLKRVDETHRLLRRQPGFIRDLILEQAAGPGRVNVMTLAQWESQQSIDAAREVVAKAHAERGFDPRPFMAQLGIEAELGTYRELEWERQTSA